MPDSHSLSDHSAVDDPMTTATAEMFMRQRDEYRRGWLARGRELNELYDALTVVVREAAPGMDPVADLQALGAERDRLRAAIEEYCLWEPGRRGHAAAHRRLREALNGGDS